MEQSKSTISLAEERKLLRSITDKIDTLKAAALDLDELVCKVDNGRMLSGTHCNKVFMSKVDGLIVSLYLQVNEISDYVCDSGMLRNKDDLEGVGNE